jgi:tRNA threonylcarbamoyladenosine biosynthesis protein TsaE
MIGASTTDNAGTGRFPLDFISHSPEQTRRVGGRLGQHARAGDVFLLSGPFGAGKTLFTHGLAAGLGIAERVTSPSFTLINEYAGQDAAGLPFRLYHVDLYRLETPAEIASVGLEGIFDDAGGICAVEWPDRLGDYGVLDHLLIVLRPVSETKRRLTFLPRGPRYEALLRMVKAEAFGVER